MYISARPQRRQSRSARRQFQNRPENHIHVRKRNDNTSNREALEMFIPDGTDKNAACGKRVAATASEVIYKDVLGNEKESAKFRAFVLNGLQSRGDEDIFIACTDTSPDLWRPSMSPFLRPNFRTPASSSCAAKPNPCFRPMTACLKCRIWP